MNIQTNLPDVKTPNRAPFMASTFGALAPLGDRLASLERELSDTCRARNKAIATEARRLRGKIRDFQPSVTMIGQVKAGKTTLVNAMAGHPGLLPADVNPWTSVVTSLHMAPPRGLENRRAAFKFFSEDEWNHLVLRGGRVGELASRAGADQELEKVRRQLEHMREKSRTRLGRRFEMLLGQTHDYECFDQELIERYVCLGDDFWEETGGNPDQGRFADITKSADLWFDNPGLPVGLCLRDTPGVNDTFMIREQITIHALRDSRICVMVLSAHQALSSVDLALIRLISNVKSRDVIIFVNRIDELGDPANEVPQIRASILDTLKRHNGPSDVEILFGSGHWATHALSGNYDDLGRQSAERLLNWADATLQRKDLAQSDDEMVWQLSGLPALGLAITQRVEDGAGARIEALVEAARQNLQTSTAVSQSVAALPQVSAENCTLGADEIRDAMQVISNQAFGAFEMQMSAVKVKFEDRVESARDTFLSRASAALVAHLESYGELEVWTYDASGLRLLLKSAYRVFAQSANRVGQDVLAQAAVDISALYARAYPVQSSPPTLDPPPVPPVPAPVVLGSTIALDMRGGWWNRFWRRCRGYNAFLENFSGLICEETRPIIQALCHENASQFEDSIRVTLRDFLASQTAIMADIATQAQDGSDSTDHPPSAPTYS